MTLAIEESVHVGAPPDVVWKLLANPFGWRLWWPACLSAATADNRPMREGSQLEITLKLGILPLTLRPIVELIQPPRTLIWRDQRFGITGRHAFYIEPKPDGCRVRQRESLEGTGLLVFRLLRFDHATAVMFRQNLQGLRRKAERGG